MASRLLAAWSPGKGDNMRKETIITAIVAVLVAIFDLLRVFGIVVPIEDATVYSVVSIIVAAVIYWRNQDWTDVMRISTAKGRAAKKAATRCSAVGRERTLSSGSSGIISFSIVFRSDASRTALSGMRKFKPESDLCRIRRRMNQRFLRTASATWRPLRP